MTDAKEHPLLKRHFRKSDFSEILDSDAAQNPQTVKQLILSIEELVKSKTNTSKRLTYNQLRNIYDIVKKDEFSTDILGFVLTLPKLAYIEARQEGEGRELVNFIRELATAVSSEKQYKVFIELMTALVAYHKLHVKS